jgi:hypothetical protein
MNTRRSALVAVAAVAAGGMSWPAGAAPLLPRAESLLAELDRALASRKPLVLMVSLEGCPYCKLARESYLVPLLESGQPVVQVEVDKAIPLLDLRGRASTHARVAQELGIRLAPTVLFLGRGGAEVAPRLVGVGSPDFYGAYLQDRVDAASRAVAG